MESLKTKLLRTYANSSNSIFLSHDGKGAINHSRIRMGLSALNSQRKKYHFIPDATCDSCNARSETPVHFLLHCPTYAAQRQDMLQQLINSVPNIMQPLLNFQNNPRLCKELVQIMICGTANNNNDNIIFPIVQRYLEATERFK